MSGVTKTWSRRRVLTGCMAGLVGLAMSRARAEAPDLERTVLTLPVGDGTTRKVLVLTPRAPRKGGYPLLVLLHGLAETVSQSLGIAAWSDHYGLVDADQRLRRGVVAPEAPNRYLDEDRAHAIEAELRRRPYGGFVFACPYTPNVYKGGVTELTLDRYAEWIGGTLLPAVRSAAPARKDVAATAIDGCSLGGYAAYEIFLRRPESFGAVGGVQGAYGERTAAVFAERLRQIVARLGPRAIHIESSLWDPSLKAHRALADRLQNLGIAHDLVVLPGGHDQNFLREIGALEMLLWHDRRVS